MMRPDTANTKNQLRQQRPPGRRCLPPSRIMFTRALAVLRPGKQQRNWAGSLPRQSTIRCRAQALCDGKLHGRNGWQLPARLTQFFAGAGGVELQFR